MDTLENTDVVMFYNDNDHDNGKQWATNIKEELLKIAQKDGECLEIKSNEDLTLGHSKAEALITLAQASRVICLIVTPEFINDSWSDFVTTMSVHNAFKSKQPKLVYIQLCDETQVNLGLQHLTGINAKGKSINKIAKMIKNVHDMIEMIETTPRIIPENSFKLLMIIYTVIDALNEHFQIDKTMDKLWKDMDTTIQDKLKSIGQRKNKIDTPTTDKIGCDCSEGELWKEEIQKKTYWSTDVHPFRNIQRYKTDNKKKHTDDIHKLFCGNGKHHVALTSVFLTKRQVVAKLSSQCSDVLEYLDPDGILQLLENCAEFSFNGENNALRQIHTARHLVSHIPHDFGPDDQQNARVFVKEAANFLYGQVSPKVWKKMAATIKRIDSMIIEARETKPAKPGKTDSMISEAEAKDPANPGETDSMISEAKNKDPANPGETDSMISEAKNKDPANPGEVNCADENCEETYDSLVHQPMEQLAIECRHQRQHQQKLPLSVAFSFLRPIFLGGGFYSVVGVALLLLFFFIFLFLRRLFTCS